jgi:hypothetical protein
VPRPGMAKSGWVGGAVECRTYGARIIPSDAPALPGWAMFDRRPSGPFRAALGFHNDPLDGGQETKSAKFLHKPNLDKEDIADTNLSECLTPNAKRPAANDPIAPHAAAASEEEYSLKKTSPRGLGAAKE